MFTQQIIEIMEIESMLTANTQHDHFKLDAIPIPSN